MFIGHYALGFAAKRAAPRAGLGALFVAPTLADLLWPVFLLLGLEHVHAVPSGNPFLNLWFDDYPYSHSLFTLIVWRSEEHTSELQSRFGISYAVFCLKQ